MNSALPVNLEISRGQHVGAVSPSDGFEHSVEVTTTELLSALTNHVTRKCKDGPYITRPMKGDGTRSDANAGDWPLIPVDIDELQRKEVPVLVRWAKDSNLAGCIATTYSHRAQNPKIRIWLIASRPIKPEEHAYVHRALARLVPFKMDPCMNKPSQPVFLPACPPETKDDAFAQILTGNPIDVDRLLDGYRDEIAEEQRRRADRVGSAKTGVRQPGGLIDYFNQNFDLRELLVKHGYKAKGRNRFIAPASKSRRAAAVLYDRTIISFHDPAHDALAVRNKHAQAMLLDAFAAYCKLEHNDDFKQAFAGAAKWAKTKGWKDSSTPPAQRSPKLASQLLEITFLALAWIIAGILPEGCFLLSARPKIGKSWLVLQFAIAVTIGGFALSRKAATGSVLYLALEDNERRLQSRLAKHQIKQLGDPAKLFYDTTWPRIGEGGEEAIEAWLQAHPDARLVIVDTLEKIRPQRTRNGSVYADDYAATQALKALSDKYKVAVLIVAHNKKGKAESGDPLELISGSLGLSGGCDGALVIERPRGQSDARFYVIGRDIEHEPDDGYVIRFNKATCMWEMVGDAAALGNSAAQQSVIDAIRDAGYPLTADQVGRATKRGRQAARHILNRLVSAGKLVEIDTCKPMQFDLPRSGNAGGGDA